MMDQESSEGDGGCDECKVDRRKLDELWIG